MLGSNAMIFPSPLHVGQAPMGELNENNRGEVFAVTLSIEEEGDQQSDNPIVLNLMGPDMERASGEYFMTTSFREAFEEERIFLKVFADLLPASGSSQRIQ